MSDRGWKVDYLYLDLVQGNIIYPRGHVRVRTIMLSTRYVLYDDRVFFLYSVEVVGFDIRSSSDRGSARERRGDWLLLFDRTAYNSRSQTSADHRPSSFGGGEGVAWTLSVFIIMTSTEFWTDTTDVSQLLDGTNVGMRGPN